MKMCDRCRVPGCLLDYNGKACANARKEHCPDVVFTNADHIRSMTDEELGVFLGEWADNHLFWMCDGTGEVLDWLKRPYKEDA